MFVQIVVSLVMMVISMALTPSANSAVKDAEPGNLDVPTADEGGDIVVVFGTCIIKSPNVVWYGDSRTQAIKSKGGK